MFHNRKEMKDASQQHIEDDDKRSVAPPEISSGNQTQTNLNSHRQ